MRNSEVYAFIERMYDALHSGLPIEDCLDDTKNVVMDMEEEVRKQMQAEEEQKSGIESSPFFSELKLANDAWIKDFCDRMDEVHPALGKFMQYLMEEDDPTFFIAYGEEPNLTGRSSNQWGCETSVLLYKYFMSGGISDDK